MRTARRVVPLLLALVAPFTLHAQARASAREAPEDVARRWFSATQSHGWRDAAGLVDPMQRPLVRTWLVEQVQMAEQMREQFGARLRGPRDSTHVEGMIVSEDATGGFTMPGSSPFASPDSATMRRLRAMPLPSFQGRPTLGELLALPDEALLVRVLEASRNPELPHEGPDSVDGRRRWSLDEVLARVDPRVLRPLGAVIEADSIAHVVYRVTSEELDGMPEGMGEPPVQVLELRRRAGRWYVRLTRDDSSGILSGLMIHYMGLEDGPP
jgi:hypothetical protein